MTIVLATFDPGETTGYSYWFVHEDRPIELRCADQQAGGLEGILEFQNVFQTFHTIVSESFVLDGRTPKPNVTALRIEGAMTALRSLRGMPPIIFQRNYFKSHAPDHLLKRAGLWQKGMPHANDAIRHAIAWAKTNGHRPTIEWLWPVPALD